MLLASFHPLLSLFSLTAGHFLLKYPPTIGFDDDNEGIGPCGGFDVVVNTTSAKLPVDGFPLQLLSTHPQADWLFRATTDTKAPFNWTNILPVVQETGLGAFCLPGLKIPSEFSGKPGVVQVMQDAVDGVLYQCAAVNFVKGSNSSVSSSCYNATGLTVSISNMNAFDNSANPSATSTMSMGSVTSTATAATPSTGAAERLGNSIIVLGLLVAFAVIWQKEGLFATSMMALL